MRSLVLAFIAFFLVFAGQAAAGNPNTLYWNDQQLAFLSWNDLQSTPTNTVYNTTGCAWNDMDDITASVSGKLAAATSTSHALCQITDYGNDSFYPRLAVVYVTGGSRLTVTLTDDRGHSWTAPYTRDGYMVCVSDPVYTDDTNPADYPPVPGTNGGVGFVTHFTLTVTAAKTTQFSAELELAPSHSLGEFLFYRALSSVPCP